MDRTPLERRIGLAVPLDLIATLAPLLRGHGDPTMRLRPGWAARATRTGDGPATIEIAQSERAVVVRAWGPGAELALEGVAALLGLDDPAEAFRPEHPLIARLALAHAGMRIGRTGRVLEVLVPAILEQKVTGDEARRAWRGLLRRYGTAAPGPYPLLLPPSAEQLASMPYHAWHPLGVERRRADVIQRSAAVAGRLEEACLLPAAEATRRLTAVPGIGPWTAAEVAIRAFGDPDAVSVGDYHLPHLVSWALAGEPRGTDERMLELLEPFRGQRGRVVRLLEASGMRAPRYGPRMAPRAIAGI